MAYNQPCPSHPVGMTLEEDKPASYFPKDSRENRFGNIMRLSEYVEDERYKDADTSQLYCCGSCEYMVGRFDSQTGYWCTERLFPDRPYGCCRYWSPK
jgi:hypothetical protein